MNIAFATIDNDCYEKFLGKCDLDVIIKKADRPPAIIYNEVLDETKERFVCFVHADVSCHGLLNAINKTIIERPNHLLGIVGVKNGYHWSKPNQLYDVMTLDSCCVVVDKEMGLRFDDKTFDEYHCYVEDICMQAGKVSTMYINTENNEGDFFAHHGHTWNKLGGSWGNYNKYRKLLSDKWGNIQTT